MKQVTHDQVRGRHQTDHGPRWPPKNQGLPAERRMRIRRARSRRVPRTNDSGLSIPRRVGGGRPPVLAAEVSLMETLERQNRLAEEVSQLVMSVDRLSETVGLLPEANGFEDDLAPKPIDDSQGLSHRAAQEVRLGYEIDRCSGSLTVHDRSGQYVFVPRGQWTTVDVAISGEGYWRWRCGSSNERSRARRISASG